MDRTKELKVILIAAAFILLWWGSDRILRLIKWAFRRLWRLSGGAEEGAKKRPAKPRHRPVRAT